MVQSISLLSVSAFVLPLPGSVSFSTSVNSGRSRVFAPPAPTALHMNKEFSFFTDKNVRLFKAAQKCADDESCTIEEAEQYMNQMMGVEFACGAGLYNGECCDIEWTQEIENDLVRKIETLEPVRRFREEIESQRGTAAAAQYWELSPLEAVAQPQYVLPAVLCGALLMLAVPHAGEDVSPFTLQEWMLATRDGYLAEMVSQNFQHGGLVVGDEAPLPITAQEWAWAIKGGYIDDLLTHYLKRGGL